MTKIYLDPGHGGTDSGATGHGLQEKNMTLSIAKYARDYLLSNYQCVQVRMSRITDKFVSLGDRTRDANSWGADIYISLHINAFNGSANGYEDYIYDKLGDRSNAAKLRDAIHDEVANIFTTNRGKKKANFHVLRETRMPAVLTENGFIDNKADVDFLRKDNNLKILGESHAKGIANYLELEGGGTVASTVKIETGGLNNDNLIKVIDYFRKMQWYGEAVIHWEYGNPKVTSGGLTQRMRSQYEDWLNEQGFWYKVL